LKGKTLLEHAYENGATDCVNIICKAGAEDTNTFLASKLVGDNANCEKVADLLGIDMSFEELPSEDQIKRITNTFLEETLLDRAAKSRAIECIKLLGKAGAVQSQEDELLVKYANGGKGAVRCFKGHTLTRSQGIRTCKLCRRKHSLQMWRGWECAKENANCFVTLCVSKCDFQCCNDCMEMYSR